MALNPPALAALAPVRGSVRLIAVRWALSMLAVLPGIVAAKGMLSGSVGMSPWFTEAPDPLPLPQFFKVLNEVGSAAPVMIAGVIVVWLFNQLLTAAAVEVLGPNREPGPVRVWRAILDVGGRYFFVYLRISLLAFVFLALGGRLLSGFFDYLIERGVVERWTGKTLVYTLPIVHTLLLLGWASLVGACAWWSRVIVVNGRRRYVRRLLGIVPRVAWRSPIQGLLLQWALAIASVTVGAAVLFAWRQAPGAAGGWFAIWLGVLVAQAVVWHWRLRTLSLIWALPTLDDLRARPDRPWGLFRGIRKRFRRAPAPPPAVIDGAD